MGDPLLDPHLLQRIRFLKEHPEINQVALTTNAIALSRYSDEEVGFLLDALAVIQLSIGGLDAETYRQMYGVNRFDQVRQAMDRLMDLNEKLSNPADLAFGFRTNDWRFELRFKQELDAFRRRGVQISHLWTYANYGGLVESDRKLGVEVNRGPALKTRKCALPCVHLAVCWDGTITACGCADAEGSLAIGRAEKDSLAEVWGGEKRARILESFEKNSPPKVCAACSAYQQDIILSGLGIENVEPHQPLQKDFYHKFWGA
jgi:MoaA/NifB/PqqE/SkfB family radical SAM enzyme